MNATYCMGLVESLNGYQHYILIDAVGDRCLICMSAMVVVTGA